MKNQLVGSSSPTQKSQCKVIIAVGSGSKDEQGKVTLLDVKTGDTVLFEKWSGTEIKLDGTDYLIMKESDIMGIVGYTPQLPRKFNHY